MKQEKPTLFTRIATLIVDKRNLLFFCYVLAVVFSIVAMGWVSVENDLTAYLDEATETRKGLTIMEEEFTTFATANIMLSNITYDDAKEIADKIEEVEGVNSIDFDETTDHYKASAALFSVTFSGEDDDEISLQAMEKIREIVSSFDTSISTTVGVDVSANLANEMKIIIAIAAIVIILVLLLTSKSYAEIPVLLITFCTAAILNMGTNFTLGTISFISNSVAVVLQLALAIDYAIILCHRFTEERAQLPAREACITALSKAIPEVLSSSLTTISGMAALAFMHFRIGADLSIVLIKSIVLSLLCVFTLMPGLLMVFSKWMDKTAHRNFVPSVAILGRVSIKTRYIILPIFVVLLIGAFWYSNQCSYLFGTTDLRAARRNESQIESDRIKAKFGSNNMVALIVPSGDYQSERFLLQDLERYDEVESALGLANTEAMDDYFLTDELTPRQFSELIDLDYEVAQLLYSAYAVNDEDYAKVVSGLADYSVPLIDMFQFLYDEVEAGYVTLEDDVMEDLEELNQQLSDARLQLQSDQYSRMLVFLTLPEESEETFNFLTTIHHEAAKYYDSDVYIVGNSTSNADIAATFSTDNIIISVLSALFVIVVLIFTFQSVGLPILLIIVIQAAIWMNFSLPYLQGEGLFFMSYLVVSSIQMGANIDYAIVITNRYMALRGELSHKEAIIKAVDQAFPTIITSGSILASAGILIQQITTEGTIASIGQYLGYGTIISIILVLFVLPQILYLGEQIIERTAFSVRISERNIEERGKLQVNGRLRGYVSGEIDAEVKGTIIGEISATVDSGSIRNDAVKEL